MAQHLQTFPELYGITGAAATPMPSACGDIVSVQTAETLTTAAASRGQEIIFRKVLVKMRPSCKDLKRIDSESSPSPSNKIIH